MLNIILFKSKILNPVNIFIIIEYLILPTHCLLFVFLRWRDFTIALLAVRLKMIIFNLPKKQSAV